ncbi:MAG: photosynthetic reaction center subunit H [Steroidobacteraceae bacterium]|jgi:photosynthetic reaction center H subunit|nr:photosynthetic reaction center subunit H [Steroidobacteraceae bacterium]
MPTGAFTGYIDVAQVVLYAFWIFFAGLLIYLHRENKREGYPLDSDRNARTDRVKVEGFPAVPRPKTFITAHGGAVDVPSDARHDRRPIAAAPVEGHPGTAYQPTGNPMLDAVGPASYAMRADEPDLTIDGRPKIVPLRVATDYRVEGRDPNPVGMPVYGGDGVIGATVRDVWVDLSEPQIRYYELEVAANGRRVLVPATFAKVSRYKNRVTVRSIMSRHFADVPGLANPDRVTLREEDRICGYYGGGTLYAEESRLGPVL